MLGAYLPRRSDLPQQHARPQHVVVRRRPRRIERVAAMRPVDEVQPRHVLRQLHVARQNLARHRGARRTDAGKPGNGSVHCVSFRCIAREGNADLQNADSQMEFRNQNSFANRHSAFGISKPHSPSEPSSTAAPRRPPAPPPGPPATASAPRSAPPAERPRSSPARDHPFNHPRPLTLPRQQHPPPAPRPSAPSPRRGKPA